MKDTRSYCLAKIPLVLVMLYAGFAFGSEQTIFAFPPSGSGGNTPAGGLISDAAGNLYGVTAAGGADQNGTVFKLSLENGAWEETVVYSFKGQLYHDGGGPASALLLDKAGNLYGTTAGGGPSNNGTVFKLAPDGRGGWTETILHAFNGTDGSLPNLAPLVEDASGNLFGVTQGYCYRGTCANGTVFEVTPQSNGEWKFAVLHSFGHTALPQSGVIFDRAGNLYGTTVYGGPQTCVVPGSGCGTVFKLTHVASSWNFATIYEFHYGNGAYPMGSLIIDTAGNLYGTTNGGGSTYNGGVAYKLSPTKTGWTETLLHVFGKPGDGSDPSSLVFDSHGNLFGSVPISTSPTLATQNGFVFELSRDANGTWKETIVYAFPQQNLAPFPNSSLIWNKSKTALVGTVGPYSDPAGGVYEVTP